MFTKFIEWIIQLFQPVYYSDFERQRNNNSISVAEYDEYGLITDDWEQAMHILKETQHRLDRIIEYNEKLYERSAQLADRSQRFRTRSMDD